MKQFLLLILCAIVPTLNAAQNTDAEFGAVAEEFIKGYLNARPLLATRLGFHEYDGRTDDFSRLALDAELQRLRRFEDRLRKFDPEELNARNGIDLRILQAAIANELFEFQDVQKFERNPMIYAHCADLNIYIARKFAPLEDRVRSLIAIESQIPNILIAGKTNLEAVLPRPHVELAIQIAHGSADFLRKDMVTADDTVKDQAVRGNFLDADRRAATALSDFANWLEKEKLPKATPNFALGETKYQRWLMETELVDLPPSKILEIGLAKLKEEQKTFADAATIIDPNKSPTEVFKETQKDHPSADKLIPDIAKDLDQIRGYVTENKIVGIPPNAKARVKETPQYDRATSFASMDTPGPFEKKATEAFYYVTPVEAGWSEQQKEEWLTSFNYYTADVTSVDEATKFFQENCYYEEKPARSEAMRGTFDYGYLNYTLGKLQILKLRDDYQAQQGDEFSLEKFHNQLLDHGMPPIRLLREILLKDKAKWDDVL